MSEDGDLWHSITVDVADLDLACGVLPQPHVRLSRLGISRLQCMDRFTIQHESSQARRLRV